MSNDVQVFPLRDYEVRVGRKGPPGFLLAVYVHNNTGNYTLLKSGNIDQPTACLAALKAIEVVVGRDTPPHVEFQKKYRCDKTLAGKTGFKMDDDLDGIQELPAWIKR